MDTCYIDGAFVDEDKAMVSVKDITVLRGYGMFDFMKRFRDLTDAFGSAAN